MKCLESKQTRNPLCEIVRETEWGLVSLKFAFTRSWPCFSSTYLYNSSGSVGKSEEQRVQEWIPRIIDSFVLILHLAPGHKKLSPKKGWDLISIAKKQGRGLLNKDAPPPPRPKLIQSSVFHVSGWVWEKECDHGIIESYVCGRDAPGMAWHKKG